MIRKARSTGRTSTPHGSVPQRNEGEGNRTAARQYNQETQQFVQSGRVD